MEEWRTISSYEGYYEVSSLGMVRSLTRTILHPTCGPQRRRGKMLTRVQTRAGYLVVGLCKGGKLAQHYVHILVAQAFLGEKPPGDIEVNHKDTNKSNCRASNLEWMTPEQNTNHAKENGLLADRRGEKSGTAKLTKIRVLNIKHRLRLGEAQSSIAVDHEVSTDCIGKINRGETWTNVR